MPHLVSYLRALLASEACANSLYLKIFLSPDELFRPIRAAVKHSLITPVAQIVAEALPAVAGQASGDLRATLYQREQCDGPRLVIEHTEYEEIVPWLQLQCDKSMHAMLSEQVSDGTARVATLAGRCAEVVKQMRDDHQEHAEGPAPSDHEERVAELQTLEAAAAVRTEYARTLMQRQRDERVLLYQPNHANDETGKRVKADVAAERKTTTTARAANDAALARAAERAAELARCERALSELRGDANSLERYREFLTFEQTWGTTAGREADDLFSSCYEDKLKIKTAWNELHGELDTQLGGNREATHEASALRKDLEATKERQLVLEGSQSRLASLLAEEDTLRAKERELRQAKLERIGAHVSVHEGRVEAITKPYDLRRSEREARGKRHEAVRAMHGQFMSHHENRSQVQKRRLATLQARCGSGQRAPQPSDVTPLFSVQEAEQQVTDATQLDEERDLVRQQAAAATKDVSHLEESFAVIQAACDQLRSGFARLDAEAGASAVASLPEGSQAEGEVDAELRELRERQEGTDAARDRLIQLVDAEIAEHGDQVASVKSNLAALNTLSERHAAEDKVAVEEKSLIDQVSDPWHSKRH